MDEIAKINLWAARAKLVVGWLMLIPIWIVIANSIGITDRMTGWIVNDWILLVPASITLMMIGLTIYYFRVMGEVRGISR